MEDFSALGGCYTSKPVCICFAQVTGFFKVISRNNEAHSQLNRANLTAALCLEFCQKQNICDRTSPPLFTLKMPQNSTKCRGIFRKRRDVFKKPRGIFRKPRDVFRKTSWHF
jgi:hypothetical protein